jgi:pyroglutamyl-peptidase
MATILLTGFGSFPGAPNNPSGLLACKLARIRRPAFADTKRIAHVFATNYSAVDQQMPALIAHHQPDAIIMFGLASRTKYIRIELQARNRLLVLFPDASGFSPRTRVIRPQGPASLRGRAPFSRLLAASRTHGKTALSRNAGSYVCNYCYWRAIEATPDGPIVVFIHVPQVHGQVRGHVRGRTRRSNFKPQTLRLGDLAKASEAILAAVVARVLAPR